MTFAKRVDQNQKDVVKALRDAGAFVVDLSKVGKGVPDLLVTYSGHTILMEVKNGEKAPFTKDQLEFMAKWTGGPLARVNSPEMAVGIINMLKKS